MDGPSIVFVRSMWCISASYWVISRLGLTIWPDNREERHTHLIRMIIAGTGTFLFHSAMAMLPLQITIVLVAASTPLNVFFQAFRGFIASLAVWICTALSFAGIVLVVDPSLLGIGSAAYARDDLAATGMLMASVLACLFALNRIFLSGRSKLC